MFISAERVDVFGLLPRGANFAVAVREGVSLMVINIRGVCAPLAIINQYTKRIPI